MRIEECLSPARGRIDATIKANRTVGKAGQRRVLIKQERIVIALRAGGGDGRQRCGTGGIEYRLSADLPPETVARLARARLPPTIPLNISLPAVLMVKSRGVAVASESTVAFKVNVLAILGR